MTWIVADVEGDKVILVSKQGTDGILHQGSYITIEDEEEDKKFIVRTEDTYQNNPYKPSPLIVDLDLPTLRQDQNCQNIISASRIIEIPNRNDGSSSFIKPQLKARRSNQEEVHYAFGDYAQGIPVFPATVFSRSVQHLYDDEKRFIHVNIPEEVFFYQMLITGRTGSGKTVAMKYLAQYFIEKMNGAVLAINVKEEDMLTMDNPTETTNSVIKKEWEDLGIQPNGIERYKIYYPGNKKPKYSRYVNIDLTESITLKIKNIDPETLTGLIQNISDLAADQLPGIFRYWKNKIAEENNNLKDFVLYFADPEKKGVYQSENSLGDVLPTKMHTSTISNINRALTHATEFFDVEGAEELQARHILQPKKMSVIDVTGKYGFGFGSVLLRDLLDKVYEAKSSKESSVPVLIIIDEVHEFYGNNRSKEALQTLDSISRKGRSLKIGVIFASQNPEDIPKGIRNVVNSKIYFKSDSSNIKSLGISTAGFDPEGFSAGFGVARIHGLSQLKFVKIPMSLSGVHDDTKEN
ncbi:MAG: ATP-binding protein [Methanosarcinaceae archaeon]|nr:ATP-binding protein [Methanosarcinaceae archaeon]